MVKIAIIIAFRNFRDEEYFIPSEILKRADYEVVVGSNGEKGGLAQGTLGGEVEINVNIKDVATNDFTGVVFVGGPGALKNLDNEESYKLAKKFYAEKKLVAAICVAPVILAKAGILEGKKATVWSSPLDKKTVKTLQEKGAGCSGESVVADGNIITANGPAAAEEFGKKILEYLSKNILN